MTNDGSNQTERGRIAPPPDVHDCVFTKSTAHEKKTPFRSLPSKANSVKEVLAGSETKVRPSSRNAAHLMVAEVFSYLPANVFTGSCNSNWLVMPLQLIS